MTKAVPPSPSPGPGRPARPVNGGSVSVFLPLAALNKINEKAARQGGGRAFIVRAAALAGLLEAGIIDQADAEFKV